MRFLTLNFGAYILFSTISFSQSNKPLSSHHPECMIREIVGSNSVLAASAEVVYNEVFLNVWRILVVLSMLSLSSILRTTCHKPFSLDGKEMKFILLYCAILYLGVRLFRMNGLLRYGEK